MNSLIFFSIPVNPIPEILDTHPENNHATIVLLNPTVSKLHPPL
jgi:hypothetical protein